MKWKVTMRTVWLLIPAAFLFATAVQAQVSIAFVNTQRVLEQAPQAKAASERLQREFAPREANVVTAKTALKNLQEKLERDGAILSEAERSKLERDIVAKQRELKRAQTEYAEDLNLRRNQEFAKFQKEAAETVAAVAKDQGYDLVIEAGVVYANEKVDITEKVLSRLREQFAKAQPKGKK